VSKSLQHLLPDPDQYVRCVDHARSIEIEPGGTALSLDRVVLVETPLPWPKPFTSHPLLAPVARIFDDARCATSLLATVPDQRSRHDNLIGVEVHHRTEDGASAMLYRVETDQIEALMLALAKTDGPGQPHDYPHIGEPISHRSTLLVCTHGTHDVCCGSLGTTLASELSLLTQHGELSLRVKRVSHIGGHRFAPTAMSLPDGRMWAYLNSDDVGLIVNHPEQPSAELLSKCRGWWGAPPGPAQVAELAVFAKVGWDLDQMPRSVSEMPISSLSVGSESDAESSVVVYAVHTSEHRWRVGIGHRRTVPAIKCRKPGGVPAKTLDEYEVEWVNGPEPVNVSQGMPAPA